MAAGLTALARGAEFGKAADSGLGAAQSNGLDGYRKRGFGAGQYTSWYGALSAELPEARWKRERASSVTVVDALRGLLLGPAR